MKRPDRFDTLTLIATASGAAGFGLIWPPLALLFLAVVAGTLAAVIDRRTVAPRRRTRRKPNDRPVYPDNADDA